MAGLVTLVLTDIVGSTRRWVTDEGGMAADLARHDELVRACVGARGGRVVKHTGDGMITVFDDPFAAVEVAAELHRVVAAERWSVAPLQLRVAVHVGAVQVREDDVFGTSVNRAARLVSICPPGASVVSGAAAAIVGERRSSIEVRPIAEVHLHGFPEAELVHALVADGLVVPATLVGDTDAAVDGVGRPPPVEDALVGREDELLAVRRALREHRLVTVVGVGGMGKTRLALEVAASTEHSSGVWWCDLASATVDDAVLPIVMTAVGARPSAGRPAVSGVVDALAGMDGLLVLDNCEHVLGPVRDLVRQVRAGCPGSRILTTSREALGVPGEWLVPLSSMPVEDAVTLFVLRAEAATGGRAMDIDRVRSICTRLDGIPLAVELAAARCRSMSEAEIGDRLADRFRLLRGGRSSVERHRTLHAAVGWSYSMLDAEERGVFGALSVFAGGTFIDGLAAVAEVADEYDALDVLDRLVARSLVVPVATELGTRYRLLETLRQFAEEELDRQGLLADVRDRHLRWMTELAATFRDAAHTPAAGPALRRFLTELPDLRAATLHALAIDRTDSACRIVSHLMWPSIARHVFDLADWVPVERIGVARTAEAAETLALRGWLRFQLGDVDAPAAALGVIDPVLRAQGLPLLLLWVHRAWVDGDFDAADEVLASRPPGSWHEPWFQRAEVYDLNVRMMMTGAEDDAQRAIHRAEEQVDRDRRRGDPVGLAQSLTALAMACVGAGRSKDAVGAAMESIELAERWGAVAEADLSRVHLAAAVGLMAQQGGDLQDAARHVRALLSEAVAHDNLATAMAMMNATSIVVAPHDAHAAQVLAAVFERRWKQQPLLPPVEDPAERQRIGDEAESLSPRAAVDLALDALDRLHGGAVSALD